MNKIGYELFLPAVAAHLRSKEDQEDNWTQTTDTEFKQIVGLAFLNAVIKFMKDSLLYRVEIPIDLFYNVTRYDIVPPEGWLVESIIKLVDHKIPAPKTSCYTLNSIDLPCCPNNDMPTAFFIQVAISAKRTLSKCKFNEDFIEMHYEVILNGILHRMYAMKVREWYSAGSSLEHQKLYRNGVNDSKRQNLTSGKAIKLHIERLSNGASR